MCALAVATFLSTAETVFQLITVEMHLASAACGEIKWKIKSVVYVQAYHCAVARASKMNAPNHVLTVGKHESLLASWKPRGGEGLVHLTTVKYLKLAELSWYEQHNRFGFSVAY